METILQRLEQAEKASDLKYGELRGAFNVHATMQGIIYNLADPSGRNCWLKLWE